MKCNQIDMGAGTVVRIAGVLDAASICELGPVIVALVAGGKPLVVLDLSSLRLIDRFGAAALVSLCRQVRARDGKIRAIGLSAQVLAMLDLLGLHRYLCSAVESELASASP